MCGIFFALSTKQHVEPSPDLLYALQHRGPDATTIVRCEEVITTADGTEQRYYLTFISTVLSLRGEVVVQQPYYRNADASVLCWNGEAWHIEDEVVSGNDTTQVYDLLSSSTDSTLEDITQRLARIAGPYALLYFDKRQQQVYLARDFLGRRSLLWRVTAAGDLLVSSVSTGDHSNAWTELDADGVYCLSITQQSAQCDVELGGYALRRQSYHFRDDTSSHKSVIPRLVLNKKHALAPLPITAQGQSVRDLETYLTVALRARVLKIPTPPAPEMPSIQPAKLAILFSGGLDCTVLARMTHDILPRHEPIDLLNVAFENPRVHRQVSEVSPYELCPDRITGRVSFEELQQVCPGRPWRLVAIDVPYTETQTHRDTVMSLMHPHNTEMDLSISYALYFASRGQGWIQTTAAVEAMHYTCSARVLLSGLGADELFAGYTRHATAFDRKGYDGLFEELDLDISRLGRRNLGRDDRVISNWGKEVRFPFLDEELVHWALQTSITDKTGFGNVEETDNPSSAIEPGKKVLRCLAWKLAMTKVAHEKKRAIQFGARTAKMETGKTKGTTLLT